MIKVLKISTGEEVIADVEELGDKYELKNPLLLLMRMDETDEEGGNVHFINYCPYSKEAIIHINKNEIIFTTEPNDKLLEYYNELNSNIIKPKTDIEY